MFGVQRLRDSGGEWFRGLRCEIRGGRPVIVGALRVAADSPGLVLGTRIGRVGVEGGTPDDVLVLFPEGLVRGPEREFRPVPEGGL